MNIPSQKLKIYTPTKDSVELQLLPLEEYNRILNSDTDKQLVSKIRDITGYRFVHILKNRAYLMKYAISYGLLINNYDDYQKITRTDEHDLISLIYDKKKQYFYHSFDMYSESIANLLKSRQYKTLPEYEKKNSFETGGEVFMMHTQVIQFEDNSVLIYCERVKDVYQGSWCPNFEQFKYLYKNNYVE